MSFLKKPEKIILFFGIPGSGINTFNMLFCKHFGLNRVCIVEEIRKIKENNDYHIFSPEVVNSVRNSLLIGRASEPILMQIINSKLSEQQSIENGASINGFPRTLHQMQTFEGLYSIKFAVHLIVDKGVMVEGTLGRRVCPKCHMVYNLCKIERNGYNIPAVLPKKNGVCDGCGTVLKAKKEDNIQTVMARLNLYEKNTHQLFDHIYKHHKVYDFVPKRGVNDFDLLKNLVEKDLT